ncbi:LLM class flavin-dependent oxidoreductase [Pedobacter antarcticus]|uniref:LLM class flavin-dependent oxidoreductase n=1 Tax=Pedobacter antarcticus TaxID=34086 RepID=UPI00088A29F0|nr:LLM class flavin-dependent oxidoreductase [Pedobacter antarcticus]SDL51755.1 FMN-dependent oxidoreductase, nitrilotriacetate monooxygenase family [Pedobacter antarcticus]
MNNRKKLKLAAIIEGTGWNHTAWQHPDMPADASENIDFYVKQARLAEDAKFESLFLIDVSHVGAGNFPHYLSMFEGVSIMSALAMKTERIGLAFTASSSYTDPYNIARQALSLDKISKGRASLNAITSNPGGMVNFSRGHLSRSDQYPMHREFLEILMHLWDTYEDDAFIRDKENGIFLNPEKMHLTNYSGKYFSVEGPLNLSRSVQGRPVLYTAGSSSTFVDIATTYTDGAFIGGFTKEAVEVTSNALRHKLEEKNRDPYNFIIATSQNPIVGRTEAEAHKKYLKLVQLNPYQRIPPPLFFGSAEQIADDIQEWYEEGIMDMLMIKQDHPHGLRDFIELVVPILQEREIFHTDYEEQTLRGNLELPNPSFRKI